LVEVGKHDLHAAMASRDGYTVCVGGAAGMVGKAVRVRIERFVDGTAYATLVSRTKRAPEPITAEGQAEKPTRQPRAKRAAAPPVPPEKTEAETVDEPVSEEPAADAVPEPQLTDESTEEPKPKKKTRPGSRGGRGRKRPSRCATTTCQWRSGSTK